MSIDDIKLKASTVAKLIGNALAQISRLRCEKIVNSIDKTLLPLVKEDGDFLDVAPKLFGPDFKKSAKDHLDQVKWWLRSHLDKLLILRVPTSRALFF